VDAVFAGVAPPRLMPMPLRGLRFAVPNHLVLDDLDQSVAGAFERSLSKLSAAGASISHIDFPELARMPAINRIGGFSTAEAYTLHREVLNRAGNQYDQNVAARIRLGEGWTAADYIDLTDTRAEMIRTANERSAPYDAVIMPTLPVIACPIDDVVEEEAWVAMNRLLLRNTLVSNFLDRCALTVPCHDRGEAPVGLSLVGEALADRRLLQIGLAVETCIAPELA
jgi:aspartyl-tRNA(Asn)/glutamyl-tRNA(Gln) amidotransferase subunit A